MTDADRRQHRDLFWCRDLADLGLVLLIRWLTVQVCLGPQRSSRYRSRYRSASPEPTLETVSKSSRLAPVRCAVARHPRVVCRTSNAGLDSPLARVRGSAPGAWRPRTKGRCRSTER